MNFFRRDVLFEEAGRDPARLETLLKEFRNARMLALAFLVVISIVLLTIGLWAVKQEWQVLNGPLRDHKEDAGWFTPRNVILLMKMVVPIVAGDFVFMLHCDACVKTLFLLRGKQNASPDRTNTPSS